MFRTILFSSVLAGLIAGLAVAAIQHFVTVPLILEAETYETSGDTAFRFAPPDGATITDAAPIPVHGEAGHAAAWSPTDGVERTFYSALTMVLMTIGFAMALLGLMIAAGVPITVRAATLWAIGGFAAVSLAPALGLPPELPGSSAADVTARQIWWACTVLATAGALYLLAYRPPSIWWAAAGVLLVAPHVVGAPRPESYASRVPAEIAGHFSAAVLVIAAVTWVLTGALAGWFHGRFAGGGNR